YDTAGPQGAAYAFVRQRLGLGASRPATNAEMVDRLMGETRPAVGTLVERYLRSRAITLTPERLWFHPECWHSGSQSRWPAMVAMRQDVTGKVVACHRTFLNWDGSGKAPVVPVRMDLGPTKGSAIRLSSVAEEILVGEGIETVLSAMQVT